MKLNHYLHFKGQAEEAFNFYKSIFGGEFSFFKRFNDMPIENQQLAEHEKDYVMHVSLAINPYTELMGSDHCGTASFDLLLGNNHYISIHIDQDETEARRLFNLLSVSGQIETQLQKTFWGALYGAFTDQYGIKWMVNCQLAPE